MKTSTLLISFLLLTTICFSQTSPKKVMFYAELGTKSGIIKSENATFFGLALGITIKQKWAITLQAHGLTNEERFFSENSIQDVNYGGLKISYLLNPSNPKWDLRASFLLGCVAGEVQVDGEKEKFEIATAYEPSFEAAYRLSRLLDVTGTAGLVFHSTDENPEKTLATFGNDDGSFLSLGIGLRFNFGRK